MEESRIKIEKKSKESRFYLSIRQYNIWRDNMLPKRNKIRIESLFSIYFPNAIYSLSFIWFISPT